MADDLRELTNLQVEDLANTIVAISREFVSSKPYDEVLEGVCRRIAGFVRCLLNSNADAWYVFPDPRLRHESKVFRFSMSGACQGICYAGEWRAAWCVSAYQFQNSDHHALCEFLAPSFGAEHYDGAKAFIDRHQKDGRELAAFSLCRLAAPMGYVLLPVRSHIEQLPRVEWHLNYLQRKAFEYFEAFYQATPRTYLPSFYQRRTKAAAILFCDLRNSTTVFQVLRIGGERHIRKFLAFLKAFMELAAEYIVSSGLGTIHGFTGDGFMATFGEHLGGDAANHAAGSCAIAAFVAERLHRGFAHLYDVWRDQGMRSFDLEHNEDVGVRLGTGLAYGHVHFDEFGTSRRESKDGSRSRGLLYYNAVGDHMNVAARLCGIANAEVSVVDVVDRPKSVVLDARQQHAKKGGALDYIAPVITTKPFALALAQAPQVSLVKETDFTTVRLKGIGNRIPVLEVWPDQLDLTRLPKEAARSAKFAPAAVASVMDSVAGDPFYGQQVRAVGDNETAIVSRLVERLRGQFE